LLPRHYITRQQPCQWATADTGSTRDTQALSHRSAGRPDQHGAQIRHRALGGHPAIRRGPPCRLRACGL